MAYVNPSGEFKRDQRYITTRITEDGRDGYPVEPGRYRLVVSLACPWAHRSVIDRELLGLTDAISLGVVDPVRDERGWRFTLDDGDVDPVLGDGFLSAAYLRADPSYDQRVTVPAIVDTLSGEVVTNDYPQISLDLSTQWREFHAPGAPDLLPAEHRSEMDVLMDEIFHDVNNRVYTCGFATSQEAYETAYAALWSRLDVLEQRLGERRFLMGDAVTEADVRLFTTLVRFDASTTATSRATATRSPRCRRCGGTHGSCSRCPGSATPWTSTRSSATTTSRTRPSTRPGSSRSGRTPRSGPAPPTGTASRSRCPRRAPPRRGRWSSRSCAQRRRTRNGRPPALGWSATPRRPTGGVQPPGARR